MYKFHQNIVSKSNGACAKTGYFASSINSEILSDPGYQSSYIRSPSGLSNIQVEKAKAPVYVKTNEAGEKVLEQKSEDILVDESPESGRRGGESSAAPSIFRETSFIEDIDKRKRIATSIDSTATNE